MFKSRFKQYIKFREKLLIIVLQLLLGLERKESLITKSLDIFLFQYNDIKLNCPHLHKIIIHSKDDKCELCCIHFMVIVLQFNYLSFLTFSMRLKSKAAWRIKSTPYNSNWSDDFKVIIMWVTKQTKHKKPVAWV